MQISVSRNGFPVRSGSSVSTPNSPDSSCFRNALRSGGKLSCRREKKRTNGRPQRQTGADLSVFQTIAAGVRIRTAASAAQNRYHSQALTTRSPMARKPSSATKRITRDSLRGSKISPRLQNSFRIQTQPTQLR